MASALTSFGSCEKAFDAIQTLPEMLPIEAISDRAVYFDRLIVELTDSSDCSEKAEHLVQALKMISGHFHLLEECFSLKTISVVPLEKIVIHPTLKSIALALANGGDETIKEKLGEGAFSEVYRAQIEKSVEPVFAVKKMGISLKGKLLSIDKRIKKAFNEIALTFALSKQMGLPILYGRKIGQEITLAYPLATQDFFGRHFEDQSKFNLELFKKDFFKVLKQIAMLHEMGIVHGDLKPDNIRYLDSDAETPQLADFDQACLQGQWRFGEGTTPYLSPEFKKTKVARIEADVWAVGVMLYSAITGTLPFSDVVVKNGLFQVQKTLNQKIQESYEYPSVKAILMRRDPEGDCRKLISTIFQVNPSKRPTIREVMENPFFSGLETESTAAAASSSLEERPLFKAVAPKAEETLAKASDLALATFSKFFGSSS